MQTLYKEKFAVKTVGVVAPSFYVEKEDYFSVGLDYLQKRGLIVKLGDTIGKKMFNTTGTSLERAMDINKMFLDSSIDVIIATDGGCRAIEVLQYLDYDMIKKNQKPFCGFSDITHILLAIYAKTGNQVIHGIDVINGFGQEESHKKNMNMEWFWKVVEGSTRTMNFSETRVLKSGCGSGEVIGGWLNAIHHLVGTEYFPKNKNIILFWEAVDEEPNKINMMLYSLRLAGLFERISGMVIGKLSNCNEKEYFDCISSVEEIILDVCEGYDFPILINAPFGHGEDKITFRFGTKININTEDIK